MNLSQRTCFWAIAVGTLALNTTIAGAAKIRKVRVNSERMSLGQLVPDVPPRIAALDLGRSPMPGRNKVVKREHIRKRLRQAMIPAKRIRIPHRIQVVRPSQTLTELELQRVVERQLPRLLPPGIHLKSMKVRGGVRLARGPIKVGFGSQRLKEGRQTVTATIKAGSSAPKPILVTLEVLQKQNRGALFVERGEPVVVLVKVKGVTIRAKALAQQNGRQGEIVAVLPLDGRKMIRGRVVQNGLIEVEL